MSASSLFKWRHFQADIILCGVRWYLRYALSYRDVEELMQERGVTVDHTTIFRWVQRYAPELAQRCRPQLKAANDSYRVDETYRDRWRMGPHPASAAKRDTRVCARGRSTNHAARRSRFIAAAVATCCTCVVSRPMARLRRRPNARTPCESVPSIPARFA
jgi:IS6 family transposase